jgi:photosystem II stability/assembly factor-like uncharacterized protein
MKKELIPLLGYRFIALFIFACTFNLSADSYPIAFKSFEKDLQVTAVCNPQLTIALDDMGQYTLDPTEVDNGSSSDQGSISLSIDITNLVCANIGIPVVVTLTVVEDITGDTDNCTSTITVIDNLAPADVCENQTIDVGDGMTQSISPFDFLASPTDNCSPSVNAVFLDPFSGWIEEVSAAVANLQDVFFADANNGWIVGNLGSIQHTTDGGATWTSQSSGVTEELRNVYFADVNTGWAVGLNETILKTSDGGTTWSIINSPLGFVSDFYSVFFLDLNNGYITGSGGVLLKTTDGGDTWVDQGVSLLVNKRDIFFTDASNGWIISQDSILHTNDGGFIWNVQDPIVSNILRKLSFVDSSNGWIVGDNGIILNTTDGGTTWTTQTSGVSSSLKDIEMFNATSGYVSGGNGTLLYTSDAGATWSPISLPNTPTADLRGLSAIDAQEVTVIGFNNSIYSYFIGTVEESTLDFDCDDIGLQNISIVLSDDEGNSTICDITLSVGDDVDPVAICQSASVILDATGNYTFDGSEIDNGSNDVCTDITFTTVPASVDCSMTGSQTVELFVEDERGNNASCTAIVNVIDAIDPVANCADLSVNLDDNGSYNLVATDIDNSSSDNCSGISLSITSGVTAYTCSNIGTPETVELTIQDASGNTSSCSALVTIDDGTAPNIVCQNFTAEIGNSGSYTVQEDDVLSSYDDNCASSLNFTFSQTDFDCADEGSIFVIDVTVTDDFGNSSTCQSNLSIVDTVLPLMGCQNISVDLDQNGSVTILSSSVVLSATDACALSPVSPASVTFDCTEIGLNQVDFSVTDDAGNTQTCTVEITVEDNIDPVITCLQNLDVVLSGTGNATIEPADILDSSTDNCTLVGLSYSLDVSSFDCADVNNTNLSIELSATDSQNNVGVCSTVVNVIDDEVPVVVCQDVTLTLDASGLASATVSQFIDQSSDNCTLSFLASPLDFSCGDSGTTVNVVALDGVNINSCTSIVTLVDNIPPSITCQDFDAFITDSNGYVFDENDALLTAEDNCGIVDYQVSNTTFECDQVGNTVEVTLTAFDAAGLSDDCVFNISIFEEVDPVITCQDFTLVLDGTGNGTLQTTDVLVSATDNCGLIEVELSKETFDCSELGSNPVTITVSDQFDNESDCIVNVEVVDLTAPLISCLPTVAIALDPVTGTANIDENDLLSAQSDNCDILSITLSEDSFNCLDETVDVTVTASDASMNVSSCISSVLVQDVTAPVIVCQDYTLEIPLGGFAGITETDVVSSVVDNCVTYDLDFSTEFFECSSLGNTDVTVTAIDNAGNASSCISAVFVVDLIAPEALCQPVTISLDQNGFAAVVATDIDAGSVDNCDELLFTLSQAIFTCDDLGLNEVVLTVIDGSGLQDNCTSDVTVIDTEAPTANCVQVFQLELDASGLAVLELDDIDIGSSDNCLIIDRSLSQTSFDCNSNSPQQVTLTVVDQSQNIDECSTLVSIVDLIDPELECISGVLVVELDPSGNASIEASEVVLSNTDNCQIEELSLSQNAFSCSDVEDLVLIQISSEDDSGNISDCIVSIDVQDNTDPVFSCQNITVSLNDEGLATVAPGDIILGVFEPCGIDDISLDIGSFDCDDIGINNVIISISDNNGNTGFCFADVTIVDEIAPIVECQNTTVSLNFGGQGSINLEDVFLSSVDNCEVATTVLSQDQFDCSHVGNTEVDIISTDVNGNIGICTAIVQVSDNIPPAVICPNSITVNVDEDCSYVVADFIGEIDILDNCTLSGAFSIEQSPVAGTTLTGSGNNDLNFFVEDVNGNPSVCATNLILNDNIAPTLICNDLILELQSDGTIQLPLDLIGAGSFDNCTSELFFGTDDPIFYDCDNVGMNSIVLFTEDGAGLMSSCTANIELIDVTAPVINCSDFTITLDDQGEGLLDNTGMNTVLSSITEACGVESVSFSIETVNCDNLGPNTLDIQVLDINGNIGFCSSTLFVEDAIAPNLICTDLDVNLGANGTAILEADDVILVANDECGIDFSTISQSFFTCEDIGPHLIEVSVFDNFGNVTSCQIDINVEDQAPPEIECIDVVVNLPANGFYNLLLEEVLVSASDVCSDNITFNYGPNNFDCENIGFNNVEVIATDEYGNFSNCNVDLILLDEIAPTAVCSDVTVELDSDGEIVVLSEQYASQSTDNCFNLFVSPSEITLNCSNIGVNTFEVFVTDPFGLSSSCSTMITVNELAPPVLSLIDTLTIVLDVNGMALVDADQFDNGTTDNCNFFNLSYDSQLQVSELPFNCDNEGLNELSIWATDTEGNQSTATVFLNIVKSGACDPTIEEVILAGRISREDDVPTPDVTVNISNGFSQLSDSNGNFSFVVLSDSSYTIDPFRNGDYTNGVTTFDIALIQAVILGLSTFDSPYKYIAADVNNSGNVSTFDILLMQKNILSIQEGFPNNDSWRFVDAAYEFPDPTNPWFGGPFPETISVTNILSNATNLDFVAVKIGDVNLSSSPFDNDAIAEDRSMETIELVLDEKNFQVDDLVSLDLSQIICDYIGAQLDLTYDPSLLQLNSVGGENLKDDNLSIDQNEGRILLSFVDFNADPDAALLNLNFRALQEGLLSQSIGISRDRLNPELISTELKVYDLELAFIESPRANLDLVQVYPNPFKDILQIDFILGNSDQVELIVRDQYGSIVFNKSGYFTEGDNRFVLEGLEAKGLLLLELRSSADQVFEKVIKL